MSGSISITPGKAWNLAGERVTMSKLNQTAQPTAQVDAGSIGARELIPDDVRRMINLPGKNLLCNGSFQLWDNDATPGQSGLVVSPSQHEYGAVKRWVTPNDANRVITRQSFSVGTIEVPGSPTEFLRWAQSSALAVNPGYLAQRLQDVRRLASQNVVFSIYVRSAANATVTPKMRQWFGNPALSRTITGTIGVSGVVMTDSGHGFKLLDVGSTVAGSGITAGTTITSFIDSGTVGLSASQTIGAGLTVVIGNVVPSSDEVVTNGTPVNLAANTWTRLVQAFAVPSVAGKVVPAIVKSFTEFRVELPQGASFQVDFADAQLELGTVVSDVERRRYDEDWTESLRYAESFNTVLSNNVGVWKPNWFLFPKIYAPVLTLYPSSGTGGTLGVDPTVQKEFVFQATNHSAIVGAGIRADAELRV